MRVHTPVYFFCLLAFFSCIPLPTFAATTVTSDITSDTHWTLDGSPYIVALAGDLSSQNLLAVAEGVTLTIDPGVVVKFEEYNGLAVGGTLNAEGTAGNPITFTSLTDDTVGGDTNGDGTDTAPADEQWMHLQFAPGSNGTFRYAVVRYGGQHWAIAANTGIANNGGTVIVDHTTLAHNGYDGFGQYGGHTTLSNSIISNQEVGISMDGGVLDMSDTRIYNNTFAGIDHYGNGALSVTHSEIDHNGAGIVAESGGSITVSNSSIHDNDSLGVDNQSQVIDYDDNGDPYVSDPGITVDARNNWWGTASGPHDPAGNAAGAGSGVSGGVTYASWLASDPFAPDPCAVPGSCASNVLFLPGIEGSRLYEGTGCGGTAEEKLWEPLGESLLKILRGAGDDKVRSLFLDSTGKSVCSDIYTKAGGVIDSVRGNTIYKSFIDEMDGLEADGTINDWKPVAYDWRLSLTDLLSKGAERDGKIYYADATSTPYIEQTLRALAGSSKTGKVTIVVHSNGGLVAKALLGKLGGEASKSLVDKLIMVGAPQSGAPVAIGALLYGHDQGISSHGIPILHSGVAKELAENSPMAYHLLPSEDYLEGVAPDTAHRVARFAGDAYSQEIAKYTTSIGNRADLDDFLLSSPSLNANLVDYANSQHASLDSWAPPVGIEVSQVAGWGVDTVAGIDFYTPPPTSVASLFEPMRAYRPIFTEDGDGTVPVPSALMMASSTNVKRYWVNLDSYFRATSIKRNHKDLFEILQLENFIKNIITNSSSALPTYISNSQPATITGNKKLTFFLHSPLTLEITDSSGNVTGLADDGSIGQDIPGSTYGEFGELKYVTVPAGSPYQLTLHGQDSGTFSLDIQESLGGAVISSATIANVPTTASTLASLTIANGIDTASPLTVDENGDGSTIISLAPTAGETVSYEPPAPAPVAQTTAGGGGVSRAVEPATISPVVVPITQPIQPIATDTPQVASPPQATTTKSVSPKNPPTRLEKAPVRRVDIPPQTASVYTASQQPILKKLGEAVYNGLYGFWHALTRFF